MAHGLTPAATLNPKGVHCRFAALNQKDSILATIRRVFDLLNVRERKKATFILLGIILNSFVEILGLAVVVPVIGLVVRPLNIEENHYLNSAYRVSKNVGIESPDQFLIALCVLMIGAFLFKAMFGLAVNLYQSRFSFDVAHRLSGNVWNYHFTQSLQDMRSTNSGQILTEINLWPVFFAQIFMVGSLMILTEMTVISLICLGLLIYNPVVFVSVAALLSSGFFLIRFFTRRRLNAYSKVEKKLEPRTNTQINHAIRGFLEIVTFQATQAVQDAYLSDLRVLFRIKGNATVINLTPAKLYEVLAVSGIAGAIIVALLQGQPQSNFLQLLTFMAICAYRVMPSMSRLNAAVIQMRRQAHILPAMEVNIPLGDAMPQHKSTEKTIRDVGIRLNNLTVGYVDGGEPVLINLNFTFLPGQIHAIVGPSGAGKSTLVNAILGLVSPQGGSIEIHNQENEHYMLGMDMDPSSWLSNIAYLSQEPFLFQGTVEQNLTMGIQNRHVDVAIFSQLCTELKLHEALGPNPLEFQLHEGGTNLSGGQRQRLALLRALLLQRPILILDEATSALDVELRDVVFQLLTRKARSGCTILMVTHDRELAELCPQTLNLGASPQFLEKV